MIIISTDRRTIIDTETGGSVFVEDVGIDPYRYYIYANYPTCGKRLLTEGMPLDYAMDTMKVIFNALREDSPCMTLNCRMPKEVESELA